MNPIMRRGKILEGIMNIQGPVGNSIFLPSSVGSNEERLGP